MVCDGGQTDQSGRATNIDFIASKPAADFGREWGLLAITKLKNVIVPAMRTDFN